MAKHRLSLSSDKPTHRRIEHVCQLMSDAHEAFHGPSIQDIRWIDGAFPAWYAYTSWGTLQYATEIAFCPFCGVKLEPLNVTLPATSA